MKNIAGQAARWAVMCIFGAAAAQTSVCAQSAQAAAVTVLPPSRLELADDSGPVAALGSLSSDFGITDDPNVRKCMCKLWQASGYGFRQFENGMDIVRSRDGSLSCRFWPVSHLYQRVAAPDNWPQDDVVAVAHTHPRKGTVQYPSSPYDYLEKYDDYVICAGGILSAEKGCTRKKSKEACTKRSSGVNWYKEWCE